MKKLFIVFALLLASISAQAAELVGVTGQGTRHQNDLHNKQHSVVTVDSASPSSSLTVASTGAVSTPYALTSTGNLTVGSSKLVVTASSGAVVSASTITGTQFKLSALNTAPSAANATGTLGEIRIVDGYIYICTATNTWKRVAITTWP